MSLPPSKWTPEDPEVADLAYWGSLDPPEYATDPVVIERIKENQARLKPKGDSDAEASSVSSAVGDAAKRHGGRVMMEARRFSESELERLREVMPLASGELIDWYADSLGYELELPDGWFEEHAGQLVAELAKDGLHYWEARSETGLVEARLVAPGGLLVELWVYAEGRSEQRGLIEATETSLALEQDPLSRAELWDRLADLVGTESLEGLYAPLVGSEPLGLYRVSGKGLTMERMTPDGWVNDPALLREIRRVGVERVGPALADEIENMIRTP